MLYIQKSLFLAVIVMLIFIQQEGMADPNSAVMNLYGGNTNNSAVTNLYGNPSQYTPTPYNRDVGGPVYYNYNSGYYNGYYNPAPPVYYYPPSPPPANYSYYAPPTAYYQYQTFPDATRADALYWTQVQQMQNGY